MGDAQYGPHTRSIQTLLDWIDSGELLRFGGSLSRRFIPVHSYEKALDIAQNPRPGHIDWTETRENAEGTFYDDDAPDISPTPSELAQLDSILDEVAVRVERHLPEAYDDVIDDVIADLNACLNCVAIRGRLDTFHGLLWEAYTCGGWPCGMTGEGSSPEDYESDLDGRQMYVFWNGPDK